MTREWPDWTDDEQLYTELGEAMRSAAAVPDRFVAAGKAAFAWRTVDAELAELSYDSVVDGALAGTRAEPAALRSLTFVASGVTIEVELTEDALLGQVVPPQPGSVQLRQKDGSATTAPVDDVGWFVLRPLPVGLFRLLVHTADGRSVLTEWATL